MKIDILKVDKDTATFTMNNKETIETVAVIYTASVQIGKCQIEGRFKFQDEFILDEIGAKQKISKLFLRKWEEDE